MNKIKPSNSENFILVDEDDFERLSKHAWNLNSGGYAQAIIKKSGVWMNVLMHREIMLAQIIKSGGDLHVDHINRDRMDNRRCNLRLCSRSQNAQNSRITEKSGRFKGVTKIQSRNRWWARIYPNGKIKHIGYFMTEEIAAIAYDFAAKKYFGDFACLNFPDLGIITEPQYSSAYPQSS